MRLALVPTAEASSNYIPVRVRRSRMAKKTSREKKKGKEKLKKQREAKAAKQAHGY